MGNRSQWLVRVAVLAVAIGAVSLAFAVVATVPSLTVVNHSIRHTNSISFPAYR